MYIRASVYTWYGIYLLLSYREVVLIMLTNTKNPKNIIVESKVTDAFDSNLKSDIVLSTINDFILALESENDKEKQKKLIENFYRKLKSWEIVTAQSEEGQRMWIQVPFKYEKTEVIHGFMKRISHFFDTGVWLPETSTIHSVDAISNIHIPMTIQLLPEEIEELKLDPIKRIVTIVKGLRQALLDVLDKGYDNFGIFKRPEGIIAMNQSKAWMTEYENKSNISWLMKHTIETQTMYDLFMRTKFKCPIDRKENNDNTTKE